LDIEVDGRLAGAQALNPVYLDTARLLNQVAPLVFVDNVFALKGGTAINLFVRDIPRLSVDLDLVFVDHRLEREVTAVGGLVGAGTGVELLVAVLVGHHHQPRRRHPDVPVQAAALVKGVDGHAGPEVQATGVAARAAGGGERITRCPMSSGRCGC